MKWPVAHSLNSTWFWLELVGNCRERLKITMECTNIQFCERLGHGWQFHTLYADALVMQGARSAAAMVLSMQGKLVCVFHREGFRLPVPSHCWEMINDANIFFCSLKSYPPSAAYMYQWIRSALVQIMACHLIGAKPLSKPVLGYCQLDP